MSRPIRKGNIAMAADGAPLQPGQVQFYQAILPPLPALDYQLAATLPIQLAGQTGNPPTYLSTQQFSITGPRFLLEPNTVQQVYPPANLAGVYNEVIPHAVLRARTLPWARSIDGSSPQPGVVPPTWMALLTLYPADLVYQSNPIPVQQGPLSAFLAPASGVIVPDIPATEFTADQLSQPLLYIELPQSTFWGIAPTLADLPYLAHAREVNTDGKEILGLDEDGYFSVVVGERLLMAGTQAGPTINTMLLVSLEGLSAQLPVDGQSAPSGAESTLVRICVLASWAVPCTQSSGDFLEIMQNLSIDLLRMPAGGPAASTDAQTIAEHAVGWGYVPLLNNTRSGEETTSWYRGPCTPVGTSIDPGGPYQYSDHAIRYDPGPDDNSQPGTGMFDMSYACAWQIGRLLALSNGAFCSALAEWRTQLANQQNEAEATSGMLLRVPGGVTALGAPATAAGLMSNARSALRGFLAQAGQAAADGAVPHKIPHTDRDLARMPGALSSADIEDILAQPGDPVLNLVHKALGTVPGRTSGERQL
ncbi:hypothetical protein [Silvibacterium acidisoli]|uniref:hypothetical protein n=1 Tax=Acidobacteriaceae bacterium ZG23-2 TaxID=2883246 RepID=UPI00406C5395